MGVRQDWRESVNIPLRWCRVSVGLGPGLFWSPREAGVRRLGVGQTTGPSWCLRQPPIFHPSLGWARASFML